MIEFAGKAGFPGIERTKEPDGEQHLCEGWEVVARLAEAMAPQVYGVEAKEVFVSQTKPDT